MSPLTKRSTPAVSMACATGPLKYEKERFSACHRRRMQHEPMLPCCSTGSSSGQGRQHPSTQFKAGEDETREGSTASGSDPKYPTRMEAAVSAKSRPVASEEVDLLMCPRCCRDEFDPPVCAEGRCAVRGEKAVGVVVWGIACLSPLNSLIRHSDLTRGGPHVRLDQRRRPPFRSLEQPSIQPAPLETALPVHMS